MLTTITEFLQNHLGADWAESVKVAIRIALVLALAWAAHWLATRVIRSVRAQIVRRQSDAEGARRVETLVRVFRYVASVVITVVALLLILGELGLSIAPILGAAGVAGIAIGFGAQSLVKDYFTGLFLLVENQLRQGDVVQAGGKSGLVEEVTLRYVRLRDYEGNVHFVPNGQISVVTNMSRDFAQAVVDVGVAYREDLDEVFPVIREVGAELREDPSYGPRILDELEIAGVEALADSAVLVRCRIKVLPLERWNVRRELLRRLKHAFDARDIEIPYPHLTLYAGAAKHGPARPLGAEVDPPEPASPAVEAVELVDRRGRS